MNAVLKTSRMASYFWPGFRKAWDQMDHQSAVMAILYAWTAMFVALNMFYWPQWYPSWLVNIAGAAIVLTSLVYGVRGVLFGDSPSQSQLSADQVAEVERSFQLAQECYLQGAYFEAEQFLLKNLANNDSDIESALLLASVQRRSGRYQDAQETLCQLQLKDRSARWIAEILVEKEKVLRSKRQSSDGPPPKG